MKVDNPRCHDERCREEVRTQEADLHLEAGLGIDERNGRPRIVGEKDTEQLAGLPAEDVSGRAGGQAGHRRPGLSWSRGG